MRVCVVEIRMTGLFSRIVKGLLADFVNPPKQILTNTGYTVKCEIKITTYNFPYKCKSFIGLNPCLESRKEQIRRQK